MCSVLHQFEIVLVYSYNKQKEMKIRKLVVAIMCINSVINRDTSCLKLKIWFQDLPDHFIIFSTLSHSAIFVLIYGTFLLAANFLVFMHAVRAWIGQ